MNLSWPILIYCSVPLYQKYQSGWPVSGPRFESKASRVWLESGIYFTAKYCPLQSYCEYISVLLDYPADASCTWRVMHFFCGHWVQGFFLIHYMTNNWVSWLEVGSCPLFCLLPCSLFQLTNSVWSTNVERMEIAGSLRYVVTMETSG